MLSQVLPFASEFLDVTKDVVRVVLAILFIFTGAAHFTNIGEDFVRMMPQWVPFPMVVMLLTGIFEIAGGVGLFVSGLIPVAAIGLILFLIAVFPANIHAALNNITFRGKPPTPLVLRAAIQVVLILLLLWIVI